MSRQLPHSASAERSVLGAVILKPAVFDRLDLSEADFYDPRHRAIWTAFRDLRATDAAIDTLTLETALEQAGKLDAIGGLAYLSHLALEVATADNAEHYERIVRQRAKAREVMLAVSAILRAGYEGEGDGDALLAQLAQAAKGIRPSRRHEAVSARDMALHRLRELSRAEQDIADGKTPSRLPTGLPALDVHIGGLPRGNLTALIARPGHGKTATVLHLAMHAPCPVLVCTFEERDRDVSDRLFAAKSGLSAIDISTLRLGREGWQRLIAAGNELPRDVYFVDARGMTDEDVVRCARQLVPELGVGLVVVDYLNRMRWSADARLRTDERIRHALNLQDDAAGELDVAWLVAAQVNRQAVKENRPPRIEDARDSGAIEEIAKLGLVVFRPYVGRKLAEGGDSELHVIVDKQNLGKNRQVCKFAWDGPTMTIAALAGDSNDDDSQVDLWHQQEARPF